jgi:hypothetical protein
MFWSICLHSAAFAITRYVTPLGAGAMDGTSWANALPGTMLQLAINASVPGDEVWVAAGVYRPTTIVDRTVAFSMRNGVAVYGGFQGTETSVSQRARGCGQYSVLSGEIGAPGNADNSYHVIRNISLNATAVLDGFTIQDANNDRAISTGEEGNGGGIYNGGSGVGNVCSPTIRNCIITNNTARYGAGIFNNAYDGGTTSPTITNCVIAYNTALEGGGGIDLFAANGGTSLPVIANTIVCNNVAQDQVPTQGGGGAMYCWGGTCSQTIVNCAFVNNVSQGLGGAIIIDDTPIFGYPSSGNCNVVVRNSIFWGNTAALPGGPQFTIRNDDLFTATYSAIDMTGQIFMVSGGMGNIINVNPQFLNIGNPLGADGCWFTADDGLQLQASSPCIDQGDNAGVAATDIWGANRVVNSVVDMGAFEYRPLTITTFNPASAGSTAVVTITGTGFIGTTAVSFGGVPASNFVVTNDTQILATVGVGASGNVQVTAAGTASRSGFTFLPPMPPAPPAPPSPPSDPPFVPPVGQPLPPIVLPPLPPPAVIDHIDRRSGTFGDQVLISGSNFVNVTGVLFGTVQASFQVLSEHQIRAIVPANGSGAIAVVRSGFQGSSPVIVAGFGPVFTYIAAPPPIIWGVQPLPLLVSDTDFRLVITGKNFLQGSAYRISPVRGDGSPDRDFGVDGVPLSINPTEMVIEIPQSLRTAGIKHIMLRSADGQQASTTASLVAGVAPELVFDRLHISTTATGQPYTLTLQGRNFAARAVVTLRGTLLGGTVPVSVRPFQETRLSLVRLSSTEARVIIPAAANTVQGRFTLRLTNTDAASTEANLNVSAQAAPFILNTTLFSSHNNSGDVHIRIQGVHFSTAARVVLAEQALIINSVQEQEIIAVIPSALRFRILQRPEHPVLMVINPDGQVHGARIQLRDIGVAPDLRVNETNAENLGKTTVSPQLGVMVYPNPTTDAITIEWSHTASTLQKASVPFMCVRLLTPLGMEVMNNTVSVEDARLLLHLHSLVRGVYIVEILHGQHQYRVPVLKQ